MYVFVADLSHTIFKYYYVKTLNHTLIKYSTSIREILIFPMPNTLIEEFRENNNYYNSTTMFGPYVRNNQI